jgi:transcriptional regulator with XRE-family HTH domain
MARKDRGTTAANSTPSEPGPRQRGTTDTPGGRRSRKAPSPITPAPAPSSAGEPGTGSTRATGPTAPEPPSRGRRRRAREGEAAREPAPTTAGPAEETPAGEAAAAETPPELPPEAEQPAPEAAEAPARRARVPRRERATHGNALGALIERQFANPNSPCRSYSDLERRSGISREALSRYVTARPDRRRSPTIDTLMAIAEAMHLSLESVCRSAASSVRGTPAPPEEQVREREEMLRSLIADLTDQQYAAVMELLRHMRPTPRT